MHDDMALTDGAGVDMDTQPHLSQRLDRAENAFFISYLWRMELGVLS